MKSFALLFAVFALALPVAAMAEDEEPQIQIDGKKVKVGNITVDGQNVDLGGTSAVTSPLGTKDGISVIENSQTRTIDCRGKVLTIAGNANKLTVDNCAKVVVNGNKNVLTLGRNAKVLEVNGNENQMKAAVLSSAKLMGNKNQLGWEESADPKKPPAVTNAGKGNAAAGMFKAGASEHGH